MTLHRPIGILLCAVMLNGSAGSELAAQVAAPSVPDATAASVAARFVGAWRLVKIDAWRTATGERVDSLSFGQIPGVIMYDARGYMSVQFDERSSPGRSYIGYFGPFTVDPRAGTVTHHIVDGTSAKPGTENVRQYRFEDGDRRLSLTPPPGNNGISTRLTWERMP